MTNAELLIMFKDQVKNHSTSIFSDALARNWFDEGQIDIVRTTECLTVDADVSSVADQREYDLPVDILRFLYINYYDGTDYFRLHSATLDELEVYEDYPEEDSSTPQYYYIKQRSTPKIGLYPKPDASQTNAMSIYYVQRPTNLTISTNNPNIPEPYHRLIIQFALYRCLQKDVKNETADRYHRQYLNDLERMRYDLNNWDKKRKLKMVPYDREHRQRNVAHNDN